jgi:hypothetical protein
MYKFFIDSSSQPWILYLSKYNLVFDEQRKKEMILNIFIFFWFYII